MSIVKQSQIYHFQAAGTYMYSQSSIIIQKFTVVLTAVSQTFILKKNEGSLLLEAMTSLMTLIFTV
ncbi:MAG: hypothetical protein Roseis2KO_55220 [Roseivirga sp.]